MIFFIPFTAKPLKRREWEAIRDIFKDDGGW